MSAQTRKRAFARLQARVVQLVREQEATKAALAEARSQIRTEKLARIEIERALAEALEAHP